MNLSCVAQVFSKIHTIILRDFLEVYRARSQKKWMTSIEVGAVQIIRLKLRNFPTLFFHCVGQNWTWDVRPRNCDQNNCAIQFLLPFEDAKVNLIKFLLWNLFLSQLNENRVLAVVGTRERVRHRESNDIANLVIMIVPVSEKINVNELRNLSLKENQFSTWIERFESKNGD